MQWERRQVVTTLAPYELCGLYVSDRLWTKSIFHRQAPAFQNISWQIGKEGDMTSYLFLAERFCPRTLWCGHVSFVHQDCRYGFVPLRPPGLLGST